MTVVHAPPAESTVRRPPTAAPVAESSPARHEAGELAVVERRFAELTADERQAWRDFQWADESLHSPYLHPEFTRHVDSVRDDVYVAVAQCGDRPVGFLPYQRRGQKGRPIGGRLSDYHGLVSAPGVDVRLDDVVRGAGLTMWSFAHLLPGQLAEHDPAVESTIEAPYLDLSEGFDAYAARRREQGSKRIKRIGKKSRQIEKDFGPLRFEVGVEDETTLELLLHWKSQQYRRTGLSNVFAHAWTVELIHRIHANRGSEFGGLLCALWAGDRLVAVEFGMRCHGVYHSWFPAYNGDLGKYSPGNVLLLRLAQAADDLGLHRFDLGAGTDHGKGSLGSDAIVLSGGAIIVDPVTRFLRSAGRSAKSLVKKSPLGFATRLVRPIREWMEFR